MCPFSSLNLVPQRQAALLAVVDVICLRHEPAELFREIAPHLRSSVAFDLISFALYDSSHEKIKMHLWEEFQGLSAPMETGVDDSIAGSVWRNQTATCIDNAEQTKRFESEVPRLRLRQISSYCAIPLTNFREKLGALGFGSKQVAAFSAEDIDFLRRAVELIALGVDATLSDEMLAEEVARQRLLLEVGNALAQYSDLPTCVASILTPMQKWATHDYVGIYLYDEASQSLRLHMSDAELAEKMAPHGLAPLEGSLAGQAYRSRRSMTLDYSGLAGMPLDSVSRGMELGVRTLCLSPLLTPNGAMGVLKVARRGGNAFSQRDIQVLEQVATMIAPMLERAQSRPGAVAEAATTKAGETSRLHKLLLAGCLSPAEGIPAKFSAPETLMESEQFLSAYFRASKVGLCILDADFHYLAINDTLAGMNGVPAAAHLGKTVREVLGDFAELVEPLFRRVFATGQAISDLEISFTLGNRTKPGHWLEHYIPIKDTNGKVTQIGVVAVEVTEQRMLEESLRGAYETLRREKKWQQVLLEVSRLLATKWDMRQAFPKVSAFLRRVLRQEYAALSLREEESGLLVPEAMDFPLGKSLSVGGEIGTAKSAGGKALRDRSPLIFGREEMQEFDPALAANLTSEGLKSLCCVPLIRPKGPLGVLILGSTRTEAFHTDDLTLLNQVAAQLAIAMENAMIAREVEQLKERLGLEKRHMEGDPPLRLYFTDIIGESAGLQRCLDQVAVIAPTDATVLILGETGTGKGLIARAIHHASKRKERNFITLNCAAIPTGLLESELFGHEKGAFTGAVSQKIGRLELADKGTLFMDEIGEIPLEVQPKLLRVLQDYEFERLGGIRTIKVDLRLIAATNRDLAESVAHKEFRSDLFYRLNVFPIRLPSLRERPEDIPHLVRYFVRKFSRVMGRNIETIPNETMDALSRALWPGNVRELENFIERSVILSDGTALRAPLDELKAETSSPLDRSLQETERQLIIRVLRETGGTISGPTGAARRLGLKRTTLQSMLQRLGITPKDYLGPRRN